MPLRLFRSRGMQTAGGALGLAIITTLSTSRAMDALASGASRADAFTAGYHRGLLVAAVLAAANIALWAVAPRLRPDAQQVAAAAAAA